MAFSLKPRLGGENSIITALATAALVIGIYNYKVGPVSDLHASPANDPNMQAAVKKAGWQALVMVAAVTLLAQDPNILILGGSAIIGEELLNRHALLSSPDNGRIQITQDAYAPAGGQASTSSPGGAPDGAGSGLVEAVAG